MNSMVANNMYKLMTRDSHMIDLNIMLLSRTGDVMKRVKKTIPKIKTETVEYYEIQCPHCENGGRDYRVKVGFRTRNNNEKKLL